MDYAEAKQRADELWSIAGQKGAALNALLDMHPRGPFGLTPDDVKALPEVARARHEYDVAQTNLRNFNAWFVKTFAKERRAEKRAKDNPGGRPKKYASAAERQAAYRARYAIVEARLKPDTVQALDRIAEARDLARTDLLADLIVWALANRDWYGATRYTRPVAPMTRRAARAGGDDPADNDADDADDGDD